MLEKVDGQIPIFHNACGMPDDDAQALFQEDRRRICMFKNDDLAYFKDGRFVAVNAAPGGEVHCITGDKALA